MNEDIMKKMGFGAEVKRVKAGKCPICNAKPGPFRDEESKREHRISGMCQKCQDKAFGV